MARGITLIELIVALAIVSLSAAVTTLAIHSLRPTDEAAARQALINARRKAIREGIAVRMMVDTLGSSSGPRALLFLPDGRTLGAANDSSR